MVREASSSMAAVAATARMFAAGFDAHHPEVDPPNHVDFSSAVFMNHTSEWKIRIGVCVCVCKVQPTLYIGLTANMHNTSTKLTSQFMLRKMASWNAPP